MPNVQAIHQAVAAQLRSLGEIRVLLRDAARRPELAPGALDALGGALEDMRLAARATESPRQRFVLGILHHEATATFTGPRGLPPAWLRRDAAGSVLIRHDVVAANLAERPQAVVRLLVALEAQCLVPLLEAWSRPAVAAPSLVG